MRPKRYIVWSKRKVNLKNPFQKKWYVKQVLTYGKAVDVAALDWEEIRQYLPELGLPRHIKRLWENYFYAKK